MKKHLLTNHSREYAFIGVLIACVILLGVSLLLVDEYADVLDDQVSMRVEANSDVIIDGLASRMREFQDKAVYSAGILKDCADQGEFARKVNDLHDDPTLNSAKAIRFYKDGVLYDASSLPLESVPAIDAMTARGGGVSALFSDSESVMSVFAFGAPIPNSAFADFVILYYTQNILDVTTAALRVDETARERLDLAYLAVVTDPEGQILQTVKDTDAWVNFSTVDEVLNAHLDDSGIVKPLLSDVAGGGKTCKKTSINGETYSVGVACNEETYGLYAVTLYNSGSAYAKGYSFITVISTTVAILFAVMILFSAHALVTRRKIAKMMNEYGSKDPQLGCPTLLGMESIVPDVAAQYPGSTFALSVIEMKHFNYIRDTYGQEAADATLAFIYRTLNRSLDRAETVGYLGDNQFVLLVHFKTAAALTNRLRVMSSAVSDPLAAKKYNVKFLFGVCELQKDNDGKIDVRRTISCCTIAMNSVTENSIANNVVFFNDVLKETYMQNADVETKMESALAAGEFRVFYQPKVNLHNKRCAGSEALIRWYDEERNYYRPPDTFLPLFEENGFIVKLDKHVYYTVCKFIADRVAAGLKAYPISVNISRLTALSPDFLDYYISIKKKFGIANKMLILEFTENIAHESYETLSEIIDTLHKNGFLCSIDDFGSGYASFNLLKSLPMDEIKLDRVFLEKGFSDEIDKKVWESVIKLGQSLHFSVVQEGVEDEETAAYLTGIGCDIIQGYYYSKPVSTEEFTRFLQKCSDAEREEDQARQMESRLGLS